MPTERSPTKRERSPIKRGSEAGDKDGDQKRRHRLQDPLPLASPLASESKAEVNDASYASNWKTSEHGERTKHSNPTAVPRSRNFFQHDDRATAAQDGRRSGRRVTSERRSWTDLKDEEQATHRAAGSDAREKGGRSLARGGDSHVWRHDRFSDMDGGAHAPAKKRRPFREEKLPPVEFETAKNAAPEPGNAAHPVSSTLGSERREERGRDRRPLERNDHDRGYERERSFLNRGHVEKAGFLSRDRFSSGDNGGRYNGRRDKFGERQGYRPNGAGTGGGRSEKWKHDMFDEANRSPAAKNEEDPIAKVEALLAS